MTRIPRIVSASLLVSGLSIFSLTEAALGQYGSMAFDENTFTSGYRIGAPDQATAQNDALYWCRQLGGTNCQIKWNLVGNSCLTLAVSENRYYWIRPADQGTIDQQAMLTIADGVLRCTNAGGYRCAPQVTICANQQAAWQAPQQANVAQAVVNYAASRSGVQVGDGECWTLANEALKAAGAITPNSSNFDTYVYGQEVYRDFRPGDIIQWENVVLNYPNGAYYTFPHHTSVIASANGTVVDLYHQNINGDRRVRYETFDLAMKTQGLIRVYRPIPRL